MSYKSLFVRSVLVVSLLQLSPLLKAAIAADPVSDAQWWINLYHVNNNKLFCAPSSMTLSEMAGAVQRDIQAKNLPDSITDRQVIDILARLYPCENKKADTAWKARIKNVINDPKVLQSVITTAKKSVVLQKDPCPSAKFTLIDNISVYKQITFNDAGLVSGGAWKYAVHEEGCGTSRQLNVLAVVPKPETLSTAALLPGTSHADPILQKDAVRYVVIAAGGSEKGCDANFVEQTEFLKYGGKPLEGAQGSPWDELWTLRGCSHRAQVVVHFIPDRTGTTISTTISETKFTPIDTTVTN